MRDTVDGINEAGLERLMKQPDKPTPNKVRKAAVEVGKRYICKVGERLTTVRILREEGRGWVALNETTNREVSIRSAQRLRREVTT